MHVQLIQYQYHGDVDAFKRIAESHAPTVAAMDGFIAKLWLDGEGRRFGGVYVWRDRQAAEAYENSEFFTAAISGAPDVRDLTVDYYELWSAPTAVTNGGLPLPAAQTDEPPRLGHVHEDASETRARDRRATGLRVRPRGPGSI